MNQRLGIFWGCLFFWACSVSANINVNDDIQAFLDEEALQYVEALETSEGEALFSVALELQDSGVTDARVLDTAAKVAIEQHKVFNANYKNREAHDTAASLARFLAGSGTRDYHDTLSQLMTESKSRRLRNLSKTLMSRGAWYESRNKIMNDFSNHDPEHSLQITRYINLLSTADRTYGRYAAESMSRQNRADKPLLDKMAEIVEATYKSPGFANDLDAIAWYMRMLGRQGDTYHPLLKEIASYKTLDKKLKKHVGKALKGK